MISTNETRRWGICPRCHVMRESRLNNATGAAMVSLWSKCPTREQCEQEIRPGFIANSEPQQQPASTEQHRRKA